MTGKPCDPIKTVVSRRDFLKLVQRGASLFPVICSAICQIASERFGKSFYNKWQNISANLY
jgi:hypothetical protein